MTANLLSRLEGLTAPDREADALIMARCFPEWAEIGEPYLSPQCIGDEPIYWHAPTDSPYRKMPVPELTASLDATVALCERVLPGQLWHILMAALKEWSKAEGTPSDLPRFVLIAILTALEARENG
jgi:hypothetical protein